MIHWSHLLISTTCNKTGEKKEKMRPTADWLWRIRGNSNERKERSSTNQTEKLCGVSGYRLRLNQRSANVFCKGPESKYFKLYQPYGIFANAQLCHHQMKISRDNTQMNRHGGVAIKWY